MDFITSYKSIKDKKYSASQAARKIALDAISFIDNLKSEADFKKNRIQFLYIHHVFDDEVNKLRSLLDFLFKYHSFISYSEAVQKLLANKIDKPYICLSSDDGLKNNVRAAAIFKEYGISACFFICPGIINEKNPEKIKNFSAEKLHFPPVEFLTWDDVEKLCKDGHEIGSHTMSHINIAGTDPSVVTSELQQSFDIIKSRIGNPVHFAFPYGKYFHFTEKARKVVFDIGYQSCSSAERGCHVQQAQPPVKEHLLIRRDNTVLDWSLDHIKHFLRRNATNKRLQQNSFFYN